MSNKPIPVGTRRRTSLSIPVGTRCRASAPIPVGTRCRASLPLPRPPMTRPSAFAKVRVVRTGTSGSLSSVRNGGEGRGEKALHRVRARGLPEWAATPAACRPGALTGRVLRQALSNPASTPVSDLPLPSTGRGNEGEGWANPRLSPAHYLGHKEFGSQLSSLPRSVRVGAVPPGRPKIARHFRCAVGKPESPVRDDRDSVLSLLSSLPGLSIPTTSNPALKCWAILACPCGTLGIHQDQCQKPGCVPTSSDLLKSPAPAI